MKSPPNRKSLCSWFSCVYCRFGVQQFWHGYGKERCGLECLYSFCQSSSDCFCFQSFLTYTTSATFEFLLVRSFSLKHSSLLKELECTSHSGRRITLSFVVILRVKNPITIIIRIFSSQRLFSKGITGKYRAAIPPGAPTTCSLFICHQANGSPISTYENSIFLHRWICERTIL